MGMPCPVAVLFFADFSGHGCLPPVAVFFVFDKTAMGKHVKIIPISANWRKEWIILSLDTEFDPEDKYDGTQSVKAHVENDATDQRKPTKKASYESNIDVQRCLQEQPLEEGGVKPELHPT